MLMLPPVLVLPPVPLRPPDPRGVGVRSFGVGEVPQLAASKSPAAPKKANRERMALALAYLRPLRKPGWSGQRRGLEARASGGQRFERIIPPRPRNRFQEWAQNGPQGSSLDPPGAIA